MKLRAGHLQIYPVSPADLSIPGMRVRGTTDFLGFEVTYRYQAEGSVVLTGQWVSRFIEYGRIHKIIQHAAAPGFSRRKRKIIVQGVFRYAQYPTGPVFITYSIKLADPVFLYSTLSVSEACMDVTSGMSFGQAYRASTVLQ